MKTAALGVIALTLALAYGIWYSYSVILVALLAEYGWSRSLLAGAFSVFTLVHGLVNPVVGNLCARFRPLRVMAGGGLAMGLALFTDSFIASPSHLYLAFGVATAVAVAASGWVPALVHVQREYRERLGFSIGIISSGVGVGMFAVVPLTQALIDAFGWRMAFRVLAVLCTAWIVPASLLMMRATQKAKPGSEPKFKNQEKPGSEPMRGAMREMTLHEAMRTQPFWLLVIAFFFGNIGSQTLHVHQVAYLVDHGLPAMIAASVVSMVGLASIVGKAGGGWLSDRIQREFIYVGGIAILAASAFVLLAIGTHVTATAAYGYAVMLGLGYSVTAAITPAMVSDRFSGRHYGAIVGAGLVGNAFGSALGPWMAGRLYDATASYTVAFSIAATASMIAGASAWRARALRLRKPATSLESAGERRRRRPGRRVGRAAARRLYLQPHCNVRRVPELGTFMLMWRLATIAMNEDPREGAARAVLSQARGCSAVD